MTTPAAAASSARRFVATPNTSPPPPPPEANLVSRYTLDGGAATDNVSSVNGTVVGTWTSTSEDSMVVGVAGTSFYKIGGSAHITLPASQAAHNLTSVSIVFYYQPEFNNAKHVLFAASNEFSTGIGDLSVERLTNGRLRAFHVGSDGGLRFFESSAGIAATNLVVGTAVRITLTLGPTGAHIFVDDTEVASIPENLNGWNNDRVKFFGTWVDGSASPLEGAIDHIRIYSGQLTSTGVAALEDAQSIVIDPPSEGNTIPTAPPASTDFWVAPGGTGNGNSVGNPAGSWITILQGGGHRAVAAGDIIAVLGGSYFNMRNQTITGVSGTVGSPIQIVGYHPDGQTRPRIDNSHPDFRGGSPSSPLTVWQASGVGGFNTWETVATTYTTTIAALQAYGDPRDNELRFCGYQAVSGWDTMRSTVLNTYGGPGVFKGNGSQGTNGRLYISTEPAKFASESGENFPLVTSGSARNPNHMDLKLIWQNDTMVTLNGCSHLHFYNHEWFYSRTTMKLSGTCTGLKFHYVEHRAGFRGYQFQGTISDCIWQWCTMYHGLPVTFQWRDAKSSLHPFGQYVGGTYEWGSEAGSTLRDNYWLNCTFDRAFDVMVWLEGDVKGQKYLNCDFIYCRDDNIDQENSIAEEEAGYCRFFGCFAPFSWRGGNDVPGRPESELRYYYHHCIFHMIYSLYQRSLAGTYTTEPVVFLQNARVPTSVSTEHTGAEGSKKCRNFAHCTLIYGGSKTGPTLADRMSHWNANQALTIPGWSFNNIIVCKFWDCIGYDVVDEFMRDGDCLHHITPSSGRVIVKNITDRSFTKQFTTLSAAVNDSQVKSASDPLPYPGGGTWMQNAIVADPQFAAAAYDLVTQPANPLAGSIYKPANTACHSGARNLSAMAPTIKWGTAANPTRAYSYEAFRGAVDPAGNGSEIGPQPLVVLPA